MSDVRAKYVPPSVHDVSFNCPHCGALAKQFWFRLYGNQQEKDSTPLVLDPSKIENEKFGEVKDAAKRKFLMEWGRRMAQGRPFLESRSESEYCRVNLWNVSLSRCYSCDDVAIWIYDRLVWPQRGEAPPANPDLPPDVRADYEEASTILDLSPRGAAALLRLAIQRLCVHLGGKGRRLDDDIAELVEKGLDIRVKNALDIVRVIGNNAVHPGQIDLTDDRATAERLFGLVNLVAERMISEPNHIKAMYDRLPPEALKAIERRDAPKES